MSNILKGLNEGRSYGRDSWDSNMPGYQGDYGGAANWGRRNREDDEHHEIDAVLAARHAQRQEYERNGKFWLKLKDSQRHLPAGPFTGKQAANIAAVELLKQQPELKGNLLITAYGPDETQGVAEGSKEKTQGIALSKAYKKDFDGKKPGQDRQETALTSTYSKTGKPGGELKKKDVAEGLSESLVSKIEELGMIGRVEYMGPEYKTPYRATLQDKTTGKVWHSDFNDGKTAEDWLVDTLSKYEQWKNKHQGVAEDSKEQEYGPEWDEKIKRLGQMAKQGERKTVWDPVKRVYKTVPIQQSSTKEGLDDLDENLHQWFKEKWVRFGPDGKIRGDCARGDDSEGKPKCLPQSKAQNLGKKGRASAAARKRREDPNPERSGKAINVNTKKKTNEGEVEGSSTTWEVSYDYGPHMSKTVTVKASSEDEARAKVEKAAEKKGLSIMINSVEPASQVNEFASDGFNGGDDDEGFSPEIAKMAQDDGFTKGVSLADGATLERAMAINYWHSQHGGMYKQYFAKGFKAGRMEKIRHDNKQYNLNLKLMKDGSIRHGEQGVAEEQLDELSCWSGYHRVAGTKAGFPGSCAKNKTNEEQEQHSESCPHCGGEMVSEELMNEKKDACYYKVKSRYKVWPSAYASGALVKCRKKGASNWGNKSEGVAEGLSKRDLQDVAAIKTAIERLQAQLSHPNADKAAIQQSIEHEKKRLALYGQGVAEDQLDEAKTASSEDEDFFHKGKKVGSITKITLKDGMVYYRASAGNSHISGSDTRQEALKDLKELLRREKEQGVTEGSDGTVSFREMIDVVDQHYPKYYAELSSSDISEKQFERAIVNAYKAIIKKQGVAEDQLDEKWTKKYKDSINCSNPKGFSQKAHCASKQKNESAIMKGLK